MARFDRSRDRNSDSGSSFSKKPRSRDNPRGGRNSNSRDSRGSRDSNSRGSGRSFDDGPRGRGGFGRDSRGGNRPEFVRTKVTCFSCGAGCEVPFKPTSNKPVYCSDCFTKEEKGSSKGSSNRDLDQINEKLNKIMKALDIN